MIFDRSVALPDRRLVILTFGLVGLGVIMIYASSAYRSVSDGGTEFAFVARQIIRAVIGLGAMFAIAWLPYRFSCRMALYSLPFSIALLVVTVIGGKYVPESYGIGRWVTAFGVVLQPVELAKVGLALALPYWIDLHPEVTTDKRSFFKMATVPALVIGLLALQPNFGSALALSLLCLCIFWVAGVQARWIFLMLLAGALLCWLGYTHVDKIHERVDAWIQILFHASQDDEYGYQSYQALVGLGSGGLRGVGPGMSTMKYLFLPASHTDFIFAILGEELGIIGSGGLVAVLFLWFARTLKVARRAPDGLAYLVTLSIGAMILCYATLNLSVVVGLMPVTGLPLPFVSYGGSALITNLAGVGVLLSVTRSLGRRRNPHDRWRKGR